MNGRFINPLFLELLFFIQSLFEFSEIHWLVLVQTRNIILFNCELYFSKGKRDFKISFLSADLIWTMNNTKYQLSSRHCTCTDLFLFMDCNSIYTTQETRQWFSQNSCSFYLFWTWIKKYKLSKTSLIADLSLEMILT